LAFSRMEEWVRRFGASLPMRMTASCWGPWTYRIRLRLLRPSGSEWICAEQDLGEDSRGGVEAVMANPAQEGFRR
jgi:hypothetical protein